MSSQCEASYQEAKAKYNAGKNRFPDKLPSKCKHFPFTVNTLSYVRFGPLQLLTNVCPHLLKAKVHLLVLLTVALRGIVYATPLAVYDSTPTLWVNKLSLIWFTVYVPPTTLKAFQKEINFCFGAFLPNAELHGL